MTEKKQLLRGILDFLDESVILPPGDWARGNLLPISQMMKVRRRRVKSWKPGGGVSCRESKNSNPGEGGGSRRNPFERTQIPFGGLVQDIRQRHFRSYWSDIKDGFHAQCLAAIIFIFFACLSGVFGQTKLLDHYSQQPITKVKVPLIQIVLCLAGAVAFGGLMGDKTENLIGISETLIVSSISGNFVPHI